MDRVTLLCDMERYMLEEFSRRTTEVLRRQALFRVLLRPMRKFLQLNVDKEVEKDRRVIQCAADLVQTGTFPTQQDVQHLLAVSRDIDQGFLNQVVILPVKLSMQYPLIEPIRRQRIHSLLTESHQLFIQWQGMTCLRNALAILYDVPQFSKLLYDLLHLYSLETRLLGRTIRLPGLFTLARESLSQTVYVAMEAIARQLADELAGRLFRHTQDASAGRHLAADI